MTTPDRMHGKFLVKKEISARSRTPAGIPFHQHIWKKLCVSSDLEEKCAACRAMRAPLHPAPRKDGKHFGVKHGEREELFVILQFYAVGRI